MAVHNNLGVRNKRGRKIAARNWFVSNKLEIFIKLPPSKVNSITANVKL